MSELRVDDDDEVSESVCSALMLVSSAANWPSHPQMSAWMCESWRCVSKVEVSCWLGRLAAALIAAQYDVIELN